VEAFLAELHRQQPALHEGVTAIAAAWGRPEQDRVVAEVWPTLTRISVDHGVMEGAAEAGLVATVPGDFGWTDIGDFRTLGDVLPGDDDRNVIIGEDKADVMLTEAQGCVVVPQSGRLVVALGMRDTVIVDTPDALLVCPRERAQDVKKIVDSLKDRGDSRV
jgi:mannose-1-phosphate guanylyltransferase